MNITATRPIMFGSIIFGTGVSNQYFIDLLKKAKPHAASNEDAVILGNDNSTLIVTPADPFAVGASEKHYEYASDGSVLSNEYDLHGYHEPKRKQVLPKGSIPQNVLDEVRQKVSSDID